MRAALLALLAMVGCDRAFDLVTVEDSAADARSDANAVTVTFGETGADTYSGVTADTYLELEFPTANHGVTTVVSCDGSALPRVILIRFDVSAIPAGAHVESASLLLSAISQANSNVAATLMLEAWGEGASDGSPGIPNWTQRTAATTWMMPGAAPPSRGTDLIGTIRPSIADTIYEMDLEVSAVAGWVAAPDTNFGLALLDDLADGVSFRSRNHPEIGKRPVLRVTFVPP